MKKITLFLSAMLFSVMSFAAVITFTPGEFDALESSKFDVEKDGVTLSCSSGTITADQFRFFKSQTLTVSSTAGNITSIEFTCTAANDTKHGPGGFGELEGYSYADKVGTWAGSAASVTFSTTNNQVRATQVVVTIDGEGGGETPDTPVDPEEPETPVDPENPDTPVDPENPDTPEEPETPVGGIDGYSKVTNAASLVAGDKVVLYCDDAQLGVTGWNGNKDATVAESGWVEYIVEVADGGFYLKDGEQYITGAESANHFKYGEKAVCGVDKDGVLACGTKFLYKNGDYYRMYTDKSSNSAYKPFYVYKAGEGGGETPDPENPENPDPEQPDPETPVDPENPDPENPEPENPETPSGEVTFDADVDNEGVGTDSNNATAYSLTKNGVTMTVSSGILGTYNNENHYRVYKHQTLTLTSTAGNIVEVEFTCTANDETKYGPGCFTASTGYYTWYGPEGTWTGSASEVVFTAATNQVRATQVVVIIDGDIPNEPGGVENGHSWVDLGLSVKWATMNVGANKPEEYGDYFAWGETQPKDDYDWGTYKWCNGSYNTLTKYNTNSSYGTVDNKTTLDLSDDAARANWGGSWRMPTTEEQDELHNNCTWTLTTRNGVKGYKVTSKSNGNSIFLPAAGYCYSSSLYFEDRYGVYWSSSLYTDSPLAADNMGFFISSFWDWNDKYRDCGFSVRPVCP